MIILPSSVWVPQRLPSSNILLVSMHSCQWLYEEMKGKFKKQYNISNHLESFQKAANNVTNTFACFSDAVAVATLDALANIDILTAVDQGLAAVAVLEAVNEQAQWHMLAALKHTLTDLLLETASTTSVMGAAVNAVRRVAIATQVAALDDPAARIDTVVIAAASGIVHRNATTSHSLRPFPIIFLVRRSSILVDNDNSLRSSVDEHLIIILNYNWIRVRTIILIRLLRPQVVVRLIWIIMWTIRLIAQFHGNSIQVGLFVHWGWSIVGVILSVVRIGLKMIGVIDATLRNNIRILGVLSSSNFMLCFKLLDADLILINHISIPIDAIVIDYLFLCIWVSFHMVSFFVCCHTAIALKIIKIL